MSMWRLLMDCLVFLIYYGIQNSIMNLLEVSWVAKTTGYLTRRHAEH